MPIPFLMMLSYAEPIQPEALSDYKAWIPHDVERAVDFDSVQVEGELCDAVLIHHVMVCIEDLPEEEQVRIYRARSTAETLNQASQYLHDELLEISAHALLPQLTDASPILEDNDIQSALEAVLYQD